MKNKLFTINKMFNQAMIVENIESPLSAIPFHRDVELSLIHI